jgi:hypothetical protein
MSLILVVILSLLLPMKSILAQPRKLRVCVGDFPSYGIALDYLLQNKERYEVSVSTVHACAVRFKKKYFDLIMADSFIYVMNYLDTPDMRIVSLTNYSDGVDQVIGQKGRSVAELRGSRWALQRGSLSTVLLNFYLKSQGLGLRDVIMEDVKVENTPQAIGKTRFHGVVNWHPYTRLALDRGGQVLATSADYQDKLFDFVVVRRSSLGAYRPLIKAYLQERLARARNREQLYEHYAKAKKISVAHAIADFQGVYIYDSAARMKQELPRALQSLRVSAEVADISLYSGQAVQEQLRQREKEIFDFSLLD